MLVTDDAIFAIAPSLFLTIFGSSKLGEQRRIRSCLSSTPLAMLPRGHECAFKLELFQLHFTFFGGESALSRLRPIKIVRYITPTSSTAMLAVKFFPDS
jgi:hypothetical protein